MQKILSPLRKAVDDYQMIEAGDRIVVGVSGGKDSVTLMLAMHRLSRFYPKPFTVIAVIIQMSDAMDYTPLEDLMRREGISYVKKMTEIHKIVFDVRQEKNPCSLCAMMRRGALNDAAVELGANKVALGHHFNDAIETFVMNLFYNGTIGCFRPVTHLDRCGLDVIRPMIYLHEKDIVSFANRIQIPIIHNPCPADGNTSRSEIKDLIRDLGKNYEKVDERIFGAMQRAGIDGWGLPKK